MALSPGSARRSAWSVGLPARCQLAHPLVADEFGKMAYRWCGLARLELGLEPSARTGGHYQWLQPTDDAAKQWSPVLPLGPLIPRSHARQTEFRPLTIHRLKNVIAFRCRPNHSIQRMEANRSGPWQFVYRRRLAGAADADRCCRHDCHEGFLTSRSRKRHRAPSCPIRSCCPMPQAKPHPPMLGQ